MSKGPAFRQVSDKNTVASVYKNYYAVWSMSLQPAKLKFVRKYANDVYRGSSTGTLVFCSPEEQQEAHCFT